MAAILSLPQCYNNLSNSYGSPVQRHFKDEKVSASDGIGNYFHFVLIYALCVLAFCINLWFIICLSKRFRIFLSLQWRHNGRDSVSNYQPHDCLLNRLFRRRSKETSKLRVTGLCVGNSPGTGEFPAQIASYAENVSFWWREHVTMHFRCPNKVMFSMAQMSQRVNASCHVFYITIQVMSAVCIHIKLLHIACMVTSKVRCHDDLCGLQSKTFLKRSSD